jgi:hypothetical protein
VIEVARRGVTLIGLVVLVTGCVPTTSTIGGHTEAELETWAQQARALCLARTGQAPASTFTTDGCTLWPDGAWQSCCVDHDMVYWCGGSAAERCGADDQLRRCGAEHDGGALAGIMYWGVRVGGHPWLPTSWRWGYGWPWPHGYAEPKGPGSNLPAP